MNAPEDAQQYLPHPGAKPLDLPDLPLLSTPSHRKESTLSKWLLGSSSIPIAWSFDPDKMDPYTERWQTKWNYYKQTFPEEAVALEQMNESDMKQRAGWLENDLKRIQNALAEMDIPNDNAEIYSGMNFVGNLVEEILPNFQRLASLGTSTSDDQALRTCWEELREIEQVYGFVQQTSSAIRSIRDLSVARSQRSIKSPGRPSVAVKGIKSDSHSPSIHSPSSLPLNSHTLRSVEIGVTGVGLEMSNLSNHSVVDDPQQLEAGRPPDGQTAGLSSASSHRTNLAALLAIAFFGASVAWSTVFSGTRGNLVVMSWAASVFIVGCTAAASASLLVETDESIMTKHMPVRWTVRILTLISAMHVFAGVMLVSIAIAVLDPNASMPLSGNETTSRNGVKAAGGYAVSMAVVVVIAMILVRRRYTRRTWFK